ncbi:MAG: Excinuclease ABC subunit C, partial [uncultured Solirubrobacterales bacterium]
GQPGRVDRVPGHPDRGRGLPRRAELHQAVQAALQHSPARRQVVPLHRHLARRGLSARLLHARAPPPRPLLFRPVLERPARARDPRPPRQGLPVPHLRRDGARTGDGKPVPRLLHQALRGPLRGIRLQGGLPPQHRRDRRLSLGSLPRDRARARQRHGGRCAGAGVRGGGGVSQQAQGGALAARTPAHLQRGGGNGRRDRRGRRGHRRQRPGLPDPRRHPGRSPELLPRERGRARRARGRGGVRAPVLRQLAGDPAAGPRPSGNRPRADGHAGRGAGRAPRRTGRDPYARARRQAPHLRAGRAQRPPRPRPGPAAQRAPAYGADRRPRGTSGHARHAGDPHAHRVFRHLEPRRDPHRGLDGGVRGRRPQEVGLPALRRPRGRPGRFRGHERGPLAADGRLRCAPRALASREELRRELRHRARPDRHRRGQGPALGRARRAERVPRPRRDRGLPGQADRGGLPARSAPAARACTRERSAPAPPAHPGRGPSLRNRVPPRPPRQGDDALDPRRSAGGGTGAQAAAAEPLRLAGAVPGGEPRGARGGAGPAGEGGARDQLASTQGGV